MTSDSDNQIGNAGDEPARPESGPTFGSGSAGGSSGFRPLRSWGSSYENQRTVWSRMRGRIASMFSRKAHADQAVPATPAESTTPPRTDSGPAAPAPVSEYKFLWSGDESPPAQDQPSFSSVDEALPPSTRIPNASRALFSPSRKLFARLFGASERSETGDHEHRLDAAVSALDGVGAELTPPVIETIDLSVNESVAELPLIDLAETEVKTDEFEVPAEARSSLETAHEGGDTLDVDEHGFWSALLHRLFGRKASPATTTEQSDSAQAAATFLLAKFRAFYNEIIRFQHQKSEFTAGFATAVMGPEALDTTPDASAETLSKRLTELLDLQAAEAKWMGGEVARWYPEAQYAMAALADEIFAHGEWEGQPAWSKNRLEARLYRTHGADLELYKRIDKLLKELPDSAVARDLARVYLLVLAAGFQGKWRPFGLTRPIAEYRRRLYEYIHGADPLMVYAPERRMFPDAVSRTLAGQAIARYSTAQRWTAILVVLLLSYTVVAHIAWSRASADLKDVTTRIKTSTTTDGP